MRKRTLTGFAAALLVSFAAQAADAPAAKAEPAKPVNSVEDIRACMAKNLAHRGALRDLTVQSTDREGKTKSIKMKLFWKPTKAGAARMNLRVLEPAELKGASYLLLEGAGGEEVYVYMPASKQVQKISGQMMSQPLWGTDFSYGEIKQVHGVLESGAVTRKADGKVGDRAVYVLEAQTQPEKTGYQKIVSSIDQKSCVLLKSEFYGKGGKVDKVMEGDASSLFEVDQYWVMLNYTMKDQRKGTKTALTMSDLTLLEGSREPLFDPKSFYKEGVE